MANALNYQSINELFTIFKRVQRILSREIDKNHHFAGIPFREMMV